MSFSTYLKLYVLTIPVFFAIDILWLGVVAKKFYQNYLGHLLADQVNWIAAIIFYFISISLRFFIEIFSCTMALSKKGRLIV